MTNDSTYRHANVDYIDYTLHISGDMSYDSTHDPDGVEYIRFTRHMNSDMSDDPTHDKSNDCDYLKARHQ